MFSCCFEHSDHGGIFLVDSLWGMSVFLVGTHIHTGSVWRGVYTVDSVNGDRSLQLGEETRPREVSCWYKQLGWNSRGMGRGCMVNWTEVLVPKSRKQQVINPVWTIRLWICVLKADIIAKGVWRKGSSSCPRLWMFTGCQHKLKN